MFYGTDRPDHCDGCGKELEGSEPVRDCPHCRARFCMACFRAAQASDGACPQCDGKWPGGE